ncbi:MAG: nucleotide exchange factor GrpE [Solirubrobacteraceae bacterium]|jgi:molecular chaperone GrpE
MAPQERGVGVREPSPPSADAAEQQAPAGEDSPGAEDAALELGAERGGEAEAGDELAATAAKRDEYLALAQRTQADFENYRKRVARDAAAAETRGLVRVARELLPSLDNLGRAVAHADDGDTDPVLIDGLMLVQRELLGALARVGIESYGEAGERFDPELHEAVAQQPFEGREAGEIVEVYQPGYRLAGGALVRPARVLVAG